MHTQMTSCPDFHEFFQGAYAARQGKEGIGAIIHDRLALAHVLADDADQQLRYHDDVAVDIRKSSPTYGQWVGAEISADKWNQILVPVGFAHGFCCLDKENIVYYSNSNYRKKNNEIGIIWNDNDIKIKWPIKKPILSKKDQNNISLKKYCDLYK
jgi:hypothetical protein